MIEQSQAGLAAVTKHTETERAGTAERAEVAKSAETSWRTLVGRVLCVAIPITLWFAPLNLDSTAKHALSITSFMIIAWITEALDHAVTGLIGCYLFWALGIVKFNTAFSGFANDTA